jgi:hypothetical protein
MVSEKGRGRDLGHDIVVFYGSSTAMQLWLKSYKMHLTEIFCSIMDHDQMQPQYKAHNQLSSNYDFL